MGRIISLLFLFLEVVLRSEASPAVMKEMSMNFAKPMEACKQELGLSNAVDADFYNFWKDDYEVTNRDTGCAIICISHKLDLLDPSYNLQHGKAHEFAMKHGADEAKAKQLVDLMHQCLEGAQSISDECMRALGAVKCFKAEIHKLAWVPNMDLVVGEVLADV